MSWLIARTSSSDRAISVTVGACYWQSLPRWHRCLASLCLASLCLVSVQASARFEVTAVGLTAQQESAAQSAAAIWSACLTIHVPIRLRLAMIERGPTGFAFSKFVQNHVALPLDDTLYPAALAHQLAGERLHDGDDINVFLSRKTDWSLPCDGDVAPTQTDFMNVVVHEIAHGLGIASAAFTPWSGERVSSLGLPNDYVNFFDYTFELHEQTGTPFVYDRFLRLADGRSLIDFPNPSTLLTRALENDTLHFSGERASAANGGFPVGVVPGNVSHITIRQPDNPIMLPNSGIGERILLPDPILLGMLQDLGWRLQPECAQRVVPRSAQ